MVKLETGRERHWDQIGRPNKPSKTAGELCWKKGHTPNMEVESTNTCAAWQADPTAYSPPPPIERQDAYPPPLVQDELDPSSVANRLMYPPPPDTHERWLLREYHRMLHLDANLVQRVNAFHQVASGSAQASHPPPYPNGENGGESNSNPNPRRRRGRGRRGRQAEEDGRAGCAPQYVPLEQGPCPQ